MFLWLWWLVTTNLRLIWMIIRPAARFISAVFTIAAVFTLMADITRWQVGDTQPLFHSLAHHISSASPTTFDAIKNTTTSLLHLALWDYGFLVVLSIPAWMIFACASLILAFAGRERRRRVNIYAN